MATHAKAQRIAGAWFENDSKMASVYVSAFVATLDGYE